MCANVGSGSDKILGMYSPGSNLCKAESGNNSSLGKPGERGRLVHFLSEAPVADEGGDGRYDELSRYASIPAPDGSLA